MLIVFAQERIDLTNQYTQSLEISFFYDFFEWNKIRSIPIAFIIDGSNPEYLVTTLKQLRRDNEIFSSLCFVVNHTESPIDDLHDGKLPNTEILQEKIKQHQDLLSSFKRNEGYLTPQARLIKYLWLRPDFIVKAYRDWQHPRFYRYPLLDALCLDQMDPLDWLRNLASAKIIEPVSLIDRQRECKHCRSMHLRFIDVCPNCISIDIKPYPSLHCFTCGCVDVQDKFMNLGSLVCPKCNTRLRHIGSDYDRPLENYRCHSCQQTFIEGDILVRCAVCATEMSPGELMLSEIYSWRLSDKGRTVAFRGELSDLSIGFDQINFIPRDLFVHDLDWMLVIARRYPNINFSLFGIYFANLPELVEHLSHMRVLQLLEAFAQRLRDILRAPDLSTRTSENMVWLLLPNADEHGLASFRGRIEKALKAMLHESDQKLDCRFVGIPSTAIPPKENAELLLARLSGELS